MYSIPSYISQHLLNAYFVSRWGAFIYVLVSYCCVTTTKSVMYNNKHLFVTHCRDTLGLGEPGRAWSGGSSSSCRSAHVLCDLLHVSHPPGQMGMPGYVLQVTTGVEDHKPCCVGTLCHIYQYSTGPNKPHGQTQGQMVGKFLFFLWEELQSCLTIFLDTALGEEQGSRIQLINSVVLHTQKEPVPCWAYLALGIPGMYKDSISALRAHRPVEETVIVFKWSK